MMERVFMVAAIALALLADGIMEMYDIGGFLVACSIVAVIGGAWYAESCFNR